jgi:hypothetical protein
MYNLERGSNIAMYICNWLYSRYNTNGWDGKSRFSNARYPFQKPVSLLPSAQYEYISLYSTDPRGSYEPSFLGGQPRDPPPESSSLASPSWVELVHCIL